MSELTDLARTWAQQAERHTVPRRLFRELADRIDELEAELSDRSQSADVSQSAELTVEMVEAALGGKRLLPWQRDMLEGRPAK